ncbi:hypothetical protein I79_023580 [Cricetulus griseus]|uniref:Uncharacterized protein n=1 Tax=Cricetulus griseus TaxID=10029 RepID=G3IIB3_CRIGR|nr:hypothetical protein I79_023580 [Cricetulus griseus]
MKEHVSMNRGTFNTGARKIWHTGVCIHTFRKSRNVATPISVACGREKDILLRPKLTLLQISKD